MCYYWTLNAQKSARLLSLALPLLKVKKQQAKLLIKFASTLTGQGGKGLNKPIPTVLLERRRKMALLSAKLNAKGAAAAATNVLYSN